MQPRPKVTICGSFKRAPEQLADLFLELEVTGCRVLSPLSLNFVNINDDFVKLSSEAALTVAEIEKFHLRAIAESDFIWLHAPGGYVGLSGAFELGFAHALQKPIFTHEIPADNTLKTFTNLAPSVFNVLKSFKFRQ